MARRPLNGNPRISCDHQCHLRRGSAGGTDYAVGVGTPVYAPFAGRVVRQIHPLSGWRVGILAPNGHDFWGFHLSGWVAPNGAQAEEGQLIAHSGGAIGHPGAGSSTGPHLHAHVTVNGVVWGMEEYLSRFAGGGGNIIDPKKGNEEMRLVKYKKNGKNTWARFTGFTIRETQDNDEAARWNSMTETANSRDSNVAQILAWWADEAAQNIAAIAASVGQPVVDVEALSQSIVSKLDLSIISEDVADAVDAALADDFANIPTHTLDALKDRL